MHTLYLGSWGLFMLAAGAAADSHVCASTLRHVAVQLQKQIRTPRRWLVKGARWHAPLTTHAHVVKHVLADQKRPYHGMMNGCTVPRGT